MTRQTRRRIGVALAGAMVGVSSPYWGPPILSGIPAFEVREVEITGARFADPDDLRDLADLGVGASIWDDPSAWEASVSGHPLIESVRIVRAGRNRLRIEVHEVRAIALVATPRLVAVDANGERLGVDPAEHRLDLPILAGVTLDSMSGRVAEEEGRRSLAVLDELATLAPEFTRRVSEVIPLDSEALELHLIDGSLVDRLTLPYEETSRAFLQAAAAIQAAEQRGAVVSADARYAEKVFVRTGGDR
ncbi:MAG: FtsQ-type POTRA domain-containing protein [Gemmatimonadota bacterium]